MLLTEDKRQFTPYADEKQQILFFISFKLIVFGIESMVIMQLMNDHSMIC